MANSPFRWGLRVVERPGPKSTRPTCGLLAQSVNQIGGSLSVAVDCAVRPWLVHAAFALAASRTLRGTCRSRATPSPYTRTRVTQLRHAPFPLSVLGARSSAQRPEHSVAIVRTC